MLLHFKNTKMGNAQLRDQYRVTCCRIFWFAIQTSFTSANAPCQVILNPGVNGRGRLVLFGFIGSFWILPVSSDRL
jgi:hypothetical protein